jgi:hypothetical protein
MAGTRSFLPLFPLAPRGHLAYILYKPIIQDEERLL